MNAIDRLIERLNATSCDQRSQCWREVASGIRLQPGLTKIVHGLKKPYRHFTFATQGNVIGAIEILQDVSQRKIAEEALRDTQAGLEQLIVQRTSQLSFRA